MSVNCKMLIYCVCAVVITAQKSLAQASKDSVTKKSWPVYDVEPSFPGGPDKFQAFIKANIRPVDSAAGKRVIVLFVVEKDGVVDDVKIGRSVNAAADKEAIRVISLSPKWNPATQNGIAKRTQYAVPVTFF